MNRTRRGSVVLLLLLCACATAPTPKTTPKSIPEPPLADVPNLDQRALLLLLVDRQTFDEFAVQEALKGDATLREDLAVALGRIPDRRGTSVLTGLLIDDAAAVRRAAAFALGELEDPEGRTALLSALRDPDRETGILAVEALGKLGAPVVDVLEQLLPLPEEERWGRLLPNLFRFKEETRVRLAERGLNETDPVLRSRSAYALAREPLPAGLPTLRRLAADPDPRVRAWAARALGIVGEGNDLATLRPLTEGADPVGAGPLIHALRSAQRLIAAGKAPAPADWAPRLLALLADSRPHVRATVLEAGAPWIMADPGGAFAQAVTARALQETEPWERGLALVALATAKHPKAIELAVSAAGSGDPAARSRAAEAAGLLGTPAGGELLARLAGDAAPRVRAAALSAWLAADPEAGDVARRALADADSGVRAAALDWLAEHPVVPGAELQRTLAEARRDGSEEPALAAIKALAARAAAGGTDATEREAIVAVLGKAAAEGSYVLRREAGAALGGLGQPAPPLGPADQGAGSRGLPIYREIVQRTWLPRTVEIRTQRGPVTVRLACREAPLTCLNFLQLAAQGYYDGVTFHRVVPDFVVQGGDPRGDGTGGPGYSIRDEINRLRYERGAVGMALAGPDTGGSQFFFTLEPHPHLDGGYTVFGQVVGGFEAIEQLRVGDRIEKVVEVR